MRQAYKPKPVNPVNPVKKMKYKQTKTISIVTLGCSKNQVDSEKIAAKLSPQYQVIHESYVADIVMVNTCGFINDAKQESIDTILDIVEFKKQKKIEKIIVFGCLVERYKNDFTDEISDIDAFFGVNDVEKILNYLHIRKNAQKPDYQRILSTPSHYAYLKIAEGCNKLCSFCIIPQIRGKHISKSIDDLLSEAKYLVTEKGVKEIILIAQDTINYGIDLYSRPMLAELMNKISDTDGVEWLRLHYTYPSKYIYDVIDIMSQKNNICNYLDMPVQHSDNTILEKMKRNHTIEDIDRIIDYAKNKNTDIHIRTTLITGFPGESHKEFNQLLKYIKKTKFHRLGVFIYSHEENTSATQYKDDVAHKTKIKRMGNIISTQEKISLEHNLKKIGKTYKVIIDEINNNDAFGRTEYDSPEIDNSVIIHDANKHKLEKGQFVDVRITGADIFDLIAEPIRIDEVICGN